MVENRFFSIFAGFVRCGAWWRMIKVGYNFDNREIITNFALSYCCQFGQITNSHCFNDNLLSSDIEI